MDPWFQVATPKISEDGYVIFGNFEDGFEYKLMHRDGAWQLYRRPKPTIAGLT